MDHLSSGAAPVDLPRARTWSLLSAARALNKHLFSEAAQTLIESMFCSLCYFGPVTSNSDFFKVMCPTLVKNKTQLHQKKHLKSIIVLTPHSQMDNGGLTVTVVCPGETPVCSFILELHVSEQQWGVSSGDLIHKQRGPVFKVLVLVWELVLTVVVSVNLNISWTL